MQDDRSMVSFEYAMGLSILIFTYGTLVCISLMLVLTSTTEGCLATLTSLQSFGKCPWLQSVRKTRVHSPVQRKTEVLTRDNQLKLGLGFLRPLAPFMLAGVVYILYVFHMGTSDVTDFNRKHPHMLFYSIGFLSSTKVWLRPQSISIRRMMGICFLFQLGLLRSLAVSEDYLTFQARRSLVTAGRLILAAIDGSRPFTVFVNMICSASTMWLSLNLSATHAKHDQSGSRRSAGVTQDVVQELFLFYCAMTLQATVHSLISSESLATVEAKSLRQAEFTARSLLTRLCDAVVRLGPNLRLREPSQDLAALLMKEKAPDYFLGDSFVDLVEEDDREFLMQELSSSGNCVRALPVRMRDSCGNSVTMQIFHAPFLDPDDQMAHLLGLCEKSIEEGLAEERPRNRRFEAEIRGASNLEDAANSSSITPLKIEPCPLEPGLVAAWVDASDFAVKACSPAFAAIYGMSTEKPCLLDWFQKQDRKDFKADVKGICTLMRDTDSIFLGTFSLTPFAALESCVAYKTRLYFKLDAADASPDKCLFRIALQDIRVIILAKPSSCSSSGHAIQQI
eukprot:TRINITY_DN16292_c0_g1_i1.p1 TRINITY_DN16292_c0_g1~~TRINITY_DN16292_c0_g1_i1.p1  ORF type:complete len:565 (+),score=69.38 TRINITY_DN16292_c0_g1_i1:61-1755(+)